MFRSGTVTLARCHPLLRPPCINAIRRGSRRGRQGRLSTSRFGSAAGFAEERQGAHAPGACHIPLTTLQGQLDALAREPRPVAFVCRSGHRSAAACTTARTHGITAINVQGGMAAWNHAGLPTSIG